MSETQAMQLNLFEGFAPVEPQKSEESKAATKKSKKNGTGTRKLNVSSRPLTPLNQEPPKDRDRLVCYNGHKILITDRELTLEQIRQQLERDFPELSKSRTVWFWDMPEDAPAAGEGQAEESGSSEVGAGVDGKTGASENKEKAEPKPIVIVPAAIAGVKGLGGTISQAVRGFHWSVEEMLADPRPIQVLAARDGIYEVRRTPAGIFSVKLDSPEFLKDWQEGMSLTYPKIPASILNAAIGFFRQNLPNEAIAMIVWQNSDRQYTLEIPQQEATVSSISYQRLDIERWLDPQQTLVMEIHSHGYWNAYFSETDNADELATGLYAVVGRLQAAQPQLKVRYSCGGRYREIDPGDVFDLEGDWVCC